MARNRNRKNRPRPASLIAYEWISLTGVVQAHGAADENPSGGFERGAYGLSSLSGGVGGEPVNVILLSAGAACVIAAVVGGGLKAFNVDVPVITSLGRQALLFVVGLGFLVSAWVLRDKTTGSDDATKTYQRLAVASCGRIVEIRTSDLPFDVIDMSSGDIRFHKGPLVRELRKRKSGMQAELQSLWTHKPPAALRAQQAHADKVSADWMSRLGEEIRALEATAPDPVSQADADVLEKSGDVQLRAQVNDALTALAGQNCPAAG